MASQSDYQRQHQAALKQLHNYREKMRRAGNRDANDATYRKLNKAADDTAKQLKGWRKLVWG